MLLDRALGDPQRLGDLAVAEAVGDEAREMPLVWGERCARRDRADPRRLVERMVHLAGVQQRAGELQPQRRVPQQRSPPRRPPTARRSARARAGSSRASPASVPAAPPPPSRPAPASDFFDLKLDGHQLTQIAADGNPFAAATRCTRSRPIMARDSCRPISGSRRSTCSRTGVRGVRSSPSRCSRRSATCARWPWTSNARSRCQPVPGHPRQRGAGGRAGLPRHGHGPPAPEPHVPHRLRRLHGHVAVTRTSISG